MTTALNAPLPPGSTIGIIGGGQLGRMLCLAAAELGFKTHIFAPEPNAPAFDVCTAKTQAAYDDLAALSAFGAQVDVITYEFENIPAASIAHLRASGTPIAPGELALATSQDRLTEKNFLRDLSIDTAPYFPVDDLQSLQAGLDQIGRPAILKTRRLGYDGKGQSVLRDPVGALPQEWEAANKKAWEEIGANPSILEGFVDFNCEISVIAARNWQGEIKSYAPSRNEHENGILRRSILPANVSERTIQNAQQITAQIMEKLGYVGVIGVEFFVLPNEDVVVNEFAPRVHNSGHWTQDCCVTSQFEQHIRAIADWPLGDCSHFAHIEMENLIGAEVENWAALSAKPGVKLHIYGKDSAKPGRKMGHLSTIKPFTS